MAQTTSPDNIPSPDLSDQYALTQDMANMADATQNALIKRANSYIGTSSQRTAWTTAPVGTLWSDTNGDRGVWKRGAASWEEVSQADSGVRTLPLASGSGTIWYRKVGKWVDVWWAGTGSFPEGSTNLSSSPLPAEFRPANTRRGSAALNARAGAALSVASAGTVILFNSTGGARTGGEGQCSYFVP